MFRKVDYAEAGDSTLVHYYVVRDNIERGQVLAKPGINHSTY